jgi:hypothetical protein
MRLRIAVAVAAALVAGTATAQDGPVPPAGAPGSVTIPDTALLAGATAAPDCGNQYGLAGRAFCVTAPLAGVGALADAYVAHFESLGWLAAGGDDNRVVMIKRLEGGGCEGLQLLAFYDESRPAAPEAPGYLAMAPIPGDVCAAVTGSAVEPATPAAPR